MIYLQLRERIGNQMFQYAFARQLMLDTNDNLCVNIEEYIHRQREMEGWRNQLSGFCVQSFETVDNCSMHNSDISLLTRVVVNLFRRLYFFTKEDKRHKLEIYAQVILNKLGVYWNMEGYIKPRKPFSFVKDKYVYGYFESPKYFENIDSIIKKEFVPCEKENSLNEQLYNKICSSNSICVSVRRGDFVTDEFREKLYICDKTYFQNGVDFIKSKIENAIVFVFSDDIEWAKQNLKFGETYYESGMDDVYEKMRLMSACKHFVISNSTFSWWAQHLSMNNEKIVVAPNRWRNDNLEVSLYEDHWVIIDTNKPN